MIPSAGGVARGGSTADAPTPPAEAHPASPQTVRYHDEDSTTAAPYHESISVTVYPQPSAGRSCPARASPSASHTAAFERAPPRAGQEEQRQPAPARRPSYCEPRRDRTSAGFSSCVGRGVFVCRDAAP